MTIAGIAFGCAGALLAAFGLFLLTAVLAVALQGKPLDVLSAAIALACVALGALGLRAAWRRRRSAQ